MRCLLLLLLMRLAFAAPPARAGEPLLALLPLVGDAGAPVRASADERVRVAAGRYAVVQARDATAQALRSAAALGLSCDTAASSCAQQMGGLAGATRVLFGALDARGTLVLSLVGVDADGGVVTSQSVTLPVPGVARDAAVERAVLMLLAPERVLAQLQLAVEPRGARIVVDEVFRGPAPLRSALVLPPGTHRVQVTHPGFLADARELALEAGVNQRVVIELARDPDAVIVDAPAVGAVGDPEPDDRDHGRAAEGTVAVFPFTSTRVPARVVAALEEAFAAELERREGLVVLGPREVAGSLAGARPGCARDQGCLAELARALDVDTFVSGNVDVTGDVIGLGARRHDVDGGVVQLAGAASSFKDERARLLLELPGLATELYPEHAVALDTPPLDVERYTARMTGGRLPPLVFWSAAGVGGVLAVATVIAGVAALSTEDAADAGSAGALFAMGAGGTVVAIGSAAVIGAFVDWDGQ